MQATLSTSITFEGVGVHNGEMTILKLFPAPAGHGVVFVRVDLGEGVSGQENKISARYDLVVNTQLCTELSNKYGAKISTIEHLMAALSGCGVDNVLIEVDGPEIPIMDGSSQAFTHMISKVGLTFQPFNRKAIRILKPVSVSEDDKMASLIPADHFSLDVSIAFSGTIIGMQAYQLSLQGDAFVSELAKSRTFGLMKDIDYLRSHGLARGGNLSNAIIVDRDRILNKEGLRFPNEFVRHKMLDAVGDLALAGAPILGKFQGYKIGHGLTNQLLRKVFATKDAWEYCHVSRDLCMGLAVSHVEAICA